MDAARGRFQELAASRTGDEAVREQLLAPLMRWFVEGRDRETRNVTADPEPA